MQIHVTFYSYFKELAGCPEISVTMDAGSTLESLLSTIYQRHPRLAPLRRSTLTAVGVDYQRGDYALKDGDQVALFPPVQGG